MRRYRDGSGTRWSRVAWAWLLVLPPAANVGLHFFGPGRTGPSEATLPWVELASLQYEESALEAMRQRLSANARDRLPTLNDPKSGYLRVPADVLPVGDPSPSRSVLWTLPREAISVPTDSCATASGALLGRVQRSELTESLVPVPVVGIQTVLDPDFRVRFTAGDGTTKGMLQGTGRQRDGHPILEILYLSESAALTPDAPVLTEGDDGVYPPGVVIGCVASASEELGASRGLRPVVVAVLRLDEIRRVNLTWSGRVADAAELVSRHREGAR